ncbi:hypothetical protein Vi05172_g13376 [Venturia inaequalis]|nr:hypothetical protein Vi05172_g13376 [Venturia inaequalis]
MPHASCLIGKVISEEQADRQTGRQADRQTGTQADRQTGRQADRQTGRQADRHTGRQAAITRCGLSPSPGPTFT